MSVILFNYSGFIANPLFAAFSTIPQVTLQAWWNNAILIFSNNPRCGNLKRDQREYALQLLMAHLIFLSEQSANGQVPGMVTNATIDKVQVGLTPPPLPNQWQWWLGLSPYGGQLLAFL